MFWKCLGLHKKAEKGNW